MNEEISKIIYEYLAILPTYSENFTNMPSDKCLFIFRSFTNSYTNDFRNPFSPGIMFERYKSGQLCTKVYMVYYIVLYNILSDEDKQKLKQNVVEEIERHKESFEYFEETEYEDIHRVFNKIYCGNFEKNLQKLKFIINNHNKII